MSFKLNVKELKKYVGTDTEVIIPDNVTRIADKAFENCGKITSITIPDGVTKIGSKAFSGCKSLKSIVIPNGVTVISDLLFFLCENLESVVLPDSATEIGDSVFYDCKSLESIVIPEQVTKIGKSAFYGCKNLKSIVIPESVAEVGDSAFYDCDGIPFDMIPADLWITNQGMYSGYAGLTSFVIPDGVKEIEDYTFSGCCNLESITIPDSVKKIGNSAFSFCENLESITIPDSVNVIWDGAFHYCSKLTSIVIPDGVKEIFPETFFNCENLKAVILPKSIVKIYRYAFNSCKSLTSIVIHEKVKELGERAFDLCDSLKKVEIQGNIEVITDNPSVFYESVEEIVVSDSVETFHLGLIKRCANLKQLKAIGVRKIIFPSEKTDYISRADMPLILPNIALSDMKTPELKLQCILGYLTAPELYSDGKTEEYDKYMKGQQKRILPVACEFGYLELIRYYISHKRITVAVIEELVAIAQKKKDTELVAMLLNYRGENISNEKIEKHEIQVINKEFKKLDVVEKNNELLAVIDSESIDDIIRLISEGAKPSAEPMCLLLATEKNNVQIVELLLKHKAKTTGKDNDKQTPLHIAAKNCNPKIVQLLINAKASLEKYNAFHQFPPLVAVETGDIATISVFLNNSKFTPKIAARMLECAVSIRSMEVVKLLFEHFKTFAFAARAITTAMKNGDVEICMFLLEKGYTLAWDRDIFRKNFADDARKQYKLDHKLVVSSLSGGKSEWDFVRELIGRNNAAAGNTYKVIKAATERNYLDESVIYRMLHMAIKYDNSDILEIMLPKVHRNIMIPVDAGAMRQKPEHLVSIMKHSNKDSCTNLPRLTSRLIQENSVEGIEILDSWGCFSKRNIDKYIEEAKEKKETSAVAAALLEISQRINKG